MKKMFTKLFSTALLAAITLTGFAVQAQTSTDASTTSTTNVDKTETNSNTSAKKEVKTLTKADADTAWKPLRRVWGYSFGDLYYNSHADAGNRGPETNYNSVPTYRNAFQLRRVYLGYDYDITRQFRAELLLASEPNANTGVNGATNIQNSDNLVDGKMAFFIKNINLRWMNIFPGTDFVIGEMSTPGFALNESGTNAPTSLSEATWGYRSIEKTITDLHKNNSYDLGASFQGTFDPATKNFGYVIMVGNNSTANLLSAGNANTGFYKIFYGDLWGKFLNKKLYVDLYADYLTTAAATASIPGQAHNMFKIFAAYNAKPITIGAEAYTQTITSGITNGTTKLPEDATVQGLSVWVKGPIVKNLNYFARFDTYNPDTNISMTDTYSVNTNYGSYNPSYKEQFYTAGLDFNPTKNVHFMPNFWLVNYTDQRTAATTGYVAPDQTLVFRFTFFYTFGK
jgi:hypothetical protein